MKKLMTLTVLGLLSVVSYANAAGTGTGTTPPEPTPVSTVVPDYHVNLRCRFESREFDQFRDLRCEARVRFCEHKALSDAASVEECRYDGKEFFELRCNDGFRLDSREVATDEIRKDLFLNAEEEGRLATIRVKDFDRYSYERRRSDLMFSTRRFSARLEGECQVQKEDQKNEPVPSLN